jgi:hypothetical protein
VQKLSTPLYNRIQWCRKYALTDTMDTFRNLHLKTITPKAREITYRLIYNSTPLAKQQKPFCPLCRQNTPETETHIYLECPTIQNMKKTLENKIIKNETYNIDIVITLNKIPIQRDRTDLEQKARTVAIYRQTIWNSRIKAKHDKVQFTGHVLDLIYRRRLDNDSTQTHIP